MKDTANIVGTIEWTRRTGGRLEPAERRRLIADLARVHLGNVLGRGGAVLHLNPGRRADIPPDRPGPSRTSAAAAAPWRTLRRHRPRPLRGVNGPSRPGSG